MRRLMAIALTMIALLCPVVMRAGEPPKDACGCAYQREEVFAFEKVPVFRKTGRDRYEIGFASKGLCDVTVGIVDGEGTVVRHLACGVLGPNAPAPFKKDALDQTLVWDGKNDLGRYVESPEECRVKVGLGLKPELDKILMWHPKRLCQWGLNLACDKDGVYVVDLGSGEVFREAMDSAICPDIAQIQVYDHQANYVRTIFPFPRDKIKPEAYVRSPLAGQSPITGPEPVMKKGPPYSFALPSGRTVISPDPASTCCQGSYFPHNLRENAFVVEKGMLTLVYDDSGGQTGLRFLRLGTDGSMPKVGYFNGESVLDNVSGPCWLSVSPGGEWMYASGLGAHGWNAFFLLMEYTVKGKREIAEHAVYRIRYDKPEPVKEPFLGVKGEAGSDNSHFKFPEGVACDKEGRIYVADSGNSRVQVFDAAGKFVKSLPMPGGETPYAVAVHRGNGAIYVESHVLPLGQMILTKFKSLAEISAPVRYVMETGRGNQEKKGWGGGDSNPNSAWPGCWQHLGVMLPVMCVDEWAPEPTIWTRNLDCDLVMLIDKGDRFELKQNLQEEARKEWKAKGWDAINPDCNFGNITADPRRPFVYVGDTAGRGALVGWIVETTKYGWNPRIDVESGEVHWVPAVSTIGYDGLIYNTVGQKIWRVDPASYDLEKIKARQGLALKPVAFDYGEGERGEISYRFCSGNSSGFGVSPQGAVYLHDSFPPMPGVTADLSSLQKVGANPFTSHGPQLPSYLAPDSANLTSEAKSLRGYKPRDIFPGGLYKGSSALLKFNEQGQLENNNLIAGLPRGVSGVQVDLQSNVYVGLCFAKPGADGKPLTGRTVAKFKPEGGRIMVNGTAVPVPLTEPPKRSSDFLTMGYGGGGIADTGPDGKPGQVGDKAWAEGLLWTVGGYSWGDCMPARFALDYFGRLFIPEIHRNSVAIVDQGGNFIMRVGEYGNADDRGPEIRMADTRFVAANDKRLFINDAVNKRILSVRLDYQKEADAGVTK